MDGFLSGFSFLQSNYGKVKNSFYIYKQLNEIQFCVLQKTDPSRASLTSLEKVFYKNGPKINSNTDILTKNYASFRR